MTYMFRGSRAKSGSSTTSWSRWSQLSLFGPFRFWTTEANKTQQEPEWSRGCKPAKRVRFGKKIKILLSVHFTVTLLFSFGKLINTVETEGRRWMAQLHSDRQGDDKKTACYSKDQRKKA